MLTLNGTKSIQQLSGEELLIQAIFGNSNVKERIDRELDRRATADIGRGRRNATRQSVVGMIEAA